jgi:hypothetical protein
LTNLAKNFEAISRQDVYHARNVDSAFLMGETDDNLESTARCRGLNVWLDAEKPPTMRLKLVFLSIEDEAGVDERKIAPGREGGL